jgi:hypothetical protein
MRHKRPPIDFLGCEVWIKATDLEDFDKWVRINLKALSKLFAMRAVAVFHNTRKLPPIEEFEGFCRDVHTQCIEHVTDAHATRH